MARRKCVTNAGGGFYTIGGHSVTKRSLFGNKTIPSGTQWRCDKGPPLHALSAGTAGKQQFTILASEDRPAGSPSRAVNVYVFTIHWIKFITMISNGSFYSGFLR